MLIEIAFYQELNKSSLFIHILNQIIKNEKTISIIDVGSGIMYTGRT